MRALRHGVHAEARACALLLRPLPGRLEPGELEPGQPGPAEVGQRELGRRRRSPGTEPSALRWAIVAMRDTTDRLGKARPGDRAQAFAVIGEAVWWVTIVDATLVRYYPDEYDSALAAQPPRQRRIIEGTFGGLRYVRNRMGYYADHADFIQPRPDEGGGVHAPITEWTWRSLPAPALETLPPRGQEWELSRYQAYQERLAGRAVGETFALASAFLALVSSDAGRRRPRCLTALRSRRHGVEGHNSGQLRKVSIVACIVCYTVL